MFLALLDLHPLHHHNANFLFCGDWFHPRLIRQQYPSGAWVARYQVRQNHKKYWYYKLQATEPCFQCKNQAKLSKYKHLGKAGTPEHIDAVMSVFRPTVWDEVQNIIHTLDECLLDISSGFEQEEEEPQD